MSKTFPARIPRNPVAPSSREVKRKAQNFATQHILDAIDSEGFENCAYYNPCSTEAEKATFSHARFMAEYGWHVKQVGMQKALENWLSGLALNIAFYNSDILTNAKAWGSLPDNATEKQEDRILENYWAFMAMRLMGLWSKHNCK